MAKQSLEFSQNWNNKLSCTAFTTLRLSGRFEVGDEVDIYLKKSKKGTATVLDKKAIKLHQINEFIANIDTGYSTKECQNIIRKLYADVKDWDTQIIFLYLLKYKL
jgi:hypothetical protein